MNAPHDARRGGSGRWRFVALLGVPLVCSLALIAFAYRAYTEQRQRYFTQSYVRALASLAEQTEGAIDGVVSSLRSAVRDAERRGKLEGEPSRKKLAQVVSEHIASVRFLRLSEAESLSLPDPGTEADASDWLVRAQPDMNRLRQTGDHMHGETSRIREPVVETADARLQVCRRVPEAYLKLPCEQGARSHEACPKWICLEKNVSQVLRPYLRGSALAHLDAFVVDDNGYVLFERGNSGLRLVQLPKPPPVDPKATPTPAASNGLPTLAEVQGSTLVRTIQLDGTSYRLFSQPLRLPAAAVANATDGRWAIGVLVPLDDAGDDSHRLPLSVILGVPLLLVATLLVLPFAQLATIGGREPLTERTVVGLAVGLVVVPGLVALGGLSWLAYGQARTRFDHEQQGFATELERAFRAEVREAEQTLRAFRDQRQRENAEAAERARAEGTWQPASAWGWSSPVGVPRPRPCDYLACTRVFDEQPRCTCEHGDSCVSNGIEDVSPREDATPYGFSYSGFEMLVLTDVSGQQIEKWASGAFTTARTDTRRHSAFWHVARERLLRLDPAGAHPYALNVMASPNTGQVLAVLSIPILDAHGVFDGVASMVADLSAWTDAVSPPDVAFALVDSSGRVLFHSVDRRRLYENLFAEMAGGMPMRAALEGARAEFFDLEYHGQPHRALMRPVQGTDWALVVLRDKDALRGALGEAAIVALGLPLLMVAASLLALALVRLLLGPVAVEALWPDPRATPRYWLLLAPMALTLTWVLSVMRSHDNPLIVLAALVAAATALTGAMLTLTAGRSRSTQRWITAAGVLVLLLLAGVWLSWQRPADLLLWVAAAAGYALVLVGWEPSWLPRAGRCEARTVQGYTAVVVLLALQLGALPTAAVFLDAVEIQFDALMRARQIRLAQATMASERSIARRLAERRPAGPSAIADGALFTWASSGPRAFDETATRFKPALRDEHQIALPAQLREWLLTECEDETAPQDAVPLRRDRCLLLRRALTGPILTTLPIWTEAAHDMRFRLYESATDGSWRAASHTVEVAPEVRPLARFRAEREVPGWDMRPAPPQGPLARLALAALVALLLLGLWRLVAWVVVRLFSLDVWEPTAPQQGVIGARGGYYLRPTLATLATLRRRADQVIDLGAADGCQDIPVTPDGTARSLLVLHLEYQLDDPAWNRRKLALLEELLVRRELDVDVVSDVDVLGYFARRLHSDADQASETSYLTAGEMARWARALAQLDKQRADLPPAPLTPQPGETDTLREECRWTPRLRGIRRAIVTDRRWTGLSAAALVAHIADLADAHYRVLWAQLTDEERLVLYHLAVRGIINPKNAELARRLMRRGLLRRTPALRVMNDSFRQFVSRVEDRSTIRAWERAAGASAWIWLRNGVLACVVVGAVVLFVTQPESYARWVALLTALTTVGGGLAQLLGLFRAPRAAAAS